MAHYAFLDSNNVVTEVIVGVDETETIDGLTPVQWYTNFRGQTCIQTSYNTIGGKNTRGAVPLNMNYAGIGYNFDFNKPGFYSPQPYPSWILNQNTFLWEPPVAYPTDGNRYTWDESSKSWMGVS